MVLALRRVQELGALRPCAGADAGRELRQPARRAVGDCLPRVDEPAALAAGARPSAKKEFAPVLIVFDERGNANRTQQSDT